MLRSWNLRSKHIDMKQNKSNKKPLYYVYSTVVDIILNQYRTGQYDELIKKNRNNKVYDNTIKPNNTSNNTQRKRIRTSGN